MDNPELVTAAHAFAYERLDSKVPSNPDDPLTAEQQQAVNRVLRGLLAVGFDSATAGSILGRTMAQIQQDREKFADITESIRG